MIPEIFPSSEALKEVLRESYTVFGELSEIPARKQGIALDWKYYNDGKAWLCKVSCKKKTVFWLSAWEGYFRASFFFVERHLEGIIALNIIGTHYTLEKECGKMIPLLFNISKKEQLPDLLKMIEFKKKTK